MASKRKGVKWREWTERQRAAGLLRFCLRFLSIDLIPSHPLPSWSDARHPFNTLGVMRWEWRKGHHWKDGERRGWDALLKHILSCLLNFTPAVSDPAFPFPSRPQEGNKPLGGKDVPNRITSPLPIKPSREKGKKGRLGLPPLERVVPSLSKWVNEKGEEGNDSNLSLIWRI